MNEHNLESHGFQIIEPNLPQIFSNSNGNGSDSGADEEIKLIGSTIRITLDDLLHKDPDIRRKAREWFRSTYNAPPKGTGDIAFQWICDEFGLDADMFREKLLTFAEEQVRQKSAKLKKNPGPAIRKLRLGLRNQYGIQKQSKVKSHVNR